MENGYLFDSDILIDYLRGVKEAIEFLESHSLPALISVITVAELYSGVRDGEERVILDDFIGAFEVVPMLPEIAVVGGLFRRDYGKSHGVGLADAVIAATAEFKKVTLVTLNHKHFPMINNKTVPYRKN